MFLQHVCEGVAGDGWQYGVAVVAVSSRTLPEAPPTPREAAATYAGPSGRDRRVDILRGGALVLFGLAVLVKVAQPDTNQFQSTATVSAIALIIALEGALIGMLYRPRLVRGLGEATLRLWRRARSWYLTSLVVVIGVAVAGLIPGIDTRPVTALDAGARPFLFGPPPANEAALAISYPLPPSVFLDVVLLRVGPWPLDVAALTCALFAIAPLCLLLLAKRKWGLLLALSVLVYATELATGFRLLPTRAEASLPVLGWQLVFVLGMIAGYYRRELVQWFRRGIGLAIFLVLVTATVGWLALPAALGMRTGGVTADLLASLAGPQTGWLFEASAPGPLRVVLPVVLTIVAYGALTAVWRPLSLLLGWLLVPIGSAVLPALVLLVCASVSTSSFASADAVYLPPVVIAAIITLTMWVVALLWRAARSRRPLL